MQKVVRAVTATAIVVKASYQILVTFALGWYLVGELKEHGRRGIKGPKK
jgi:hypothetical protein